MLGSFFYALHYLVVSASTTMKVWLAMVDDVRKGLTCIFANATEFFPVFLAGNIAIKGDLTKAGFMNKPPVSKPNVIPGSIEVSGSLVFAETGESLALAGLGAKYRGEISPQASPNIPEDGPTSGDCFITNGDGDVRGSGGVPPDIKGA